LAVTPGPGLSKRFGDVVDDSTLTAEMVACPPKIHGRLDDGHGHGKAKVVSNFIKELSGISSSKLVQSKRPLPSRNTMKQKRQRNDDCVSN